jgi:ketosteroid isomerase-like protein
MSRENVEIVRRGFSAGNRGDLDGALDEWAPDAVWDWSNGRAFDAGVYRGRDEIRAFWESALRHSRKSGLSLLTSGRSRTTG